MKSGPIRISAYQQGWDDRGVSFRVEDIEKHGPGIIVDVTRAGRRPRDDLGGMSSSRVEELAHARQEGLLGFRRGDGGGRGACASSRPVRRALMIVET